jgi:membrane-associated phospholipid phosphatase
MAMAGASSRGVSPRVGLLRLAAVLLISPTRLVAQDAVPVATQTSARLPRLHWWHGLVAVGGYAVLTSMDGKFQSFARSNRNGTTDDISSIARNMGQPTVYASVGLGVIATGIVTGDREIRDAGLRVTGSLAVTGLVVTAAKLAFGRSRPNTGESDADDFNPFSGQASAPSGHSAMAFALAASLSDEIRNPWAAAGLYTLAAGTAYSRVNDDAHWMSDVIAGAAVGVAAAKFMNGKLTLFGLKAPSLRPTSGGVAIAWDGSF